MLKNEEEALLARLEKDLDSVEGSLKLQKKIKVVKGQTMDKYRGMIHGMSQEEIYYKQFSDTVEEKCLKYKAQVSHLVTLFETALEKELND